MIFSALLTGVGQMDMEKDRDCFLRLHIRANSDSEEDQALKLQVRDAILEVTTRLTLGCNDKDGAKRAVRNGLDQIREAAEQTVAQSGSDQTVTVSLTREHFDRREYGNFYLPAGFYDSLIIELGSGEGQNWWCVIFPAVCISGSAEAETVMAMNPSTLPEKLRIADEPVPKEVRYEFWIVKVIREIFSGQ